MPREEYIRTNLDKLLYNWSNIALIAGAVLILLLSILDYVVTPENFKTFLFYRFVASLSMIVIFFVNKRRIDRTLQTTLVLLLTLIISAMIASMIAKLDGHLSPYYAGMILTLIFILGIIPLTVHASVIAGLSVYALYLIPILFYDNITNARYFIAVNAFLLAVIFTTLLWRYLSQQRLTSELGLQYDLQQQKKQLEMYSHHLEEMVAEKSKELFVSEQWHRTIFEGSNDGLVILNRDGIIEKLNRKFIEMYGFEEDYTLNSHYSLIETHRSQKEMNQMFDRVLKGESILYESVHRKSDGSDIGVEVTAKSISITGKPYIQVSLRDVAEKRKLREQLLHSQKMESIGTLTGGIAHDFNNILTAILGYAELIRMSDEPIPVDMGEKMGVIENSARRGTQLVSKLLSFSRKASVEKTPVNFNVLVKDSTNMLSRLIDRKIAILDEFDDSIPIIEADANQMEQVIMNLIINAKDAMAKGGRLELKTKLERLKSNSLDIGTAVKEGEYIHFRVSDTGEGIPEKNLAKIFDPFYTTKETGKGTGLGLATVYGIVKDHDGYITVESAVNKGSTFHVYLPAIESTRTIVEEDTIVSLYGNENILLIEDERDILNLTKDILTKHGYNVIATDDPRNGIKVFETMRNRIDLVVTDMIMPKIDGKEVIKKIKLLNPEARIMVLSGFAEQILEGTHMQINGFVKKPFDSRQILSSVRRILDLNNAASYH